MRKKQGSEPETSEPTDIDVEDFAAEVTATATATAPATPDASNTETHANADATTTNTTTFPLTRTFVHCDLTGRELAHVSLTATVTLTRVNGVTLTPSEIERRFRRNFYLSFKGGKAGALHDATATTPDARSRRTMSPEHKQKLQEARQRRRGNENSDKPKHDEEAQREVAKLATTLLDGLSFDEWFGKSDVLYACGIAAIEPQSWTLAIRHLLDTNQIEAQGEKRGREYRRVASLEKEDTK